MSKILTKKERKFQKKVLYVSASIFTLIVILFYFLMTQSGRWLVDDDEFKHVKWVVVLDGQSADMERSDLAAKIIAQGKADSMLVLGRRCLRERSNAEFYIDDLFQHGSFDSSAVFIVRHDDPSTIGEAHTIIPWLKAHKADTVLLITTAAATHRVKRIFTKLSGDFPIYLTIDVHHHQYNADAWYTNRESRKIWLREWAALFASYVDLWRIDELSAKDSAYFKPILSIKEFEKEKTPMVDLQKIMPKIQKKLTDNTEEKTDSLKTKTPPADSTKKDTNSTKE